MFLPLNPSHRRFEVAINFSKSFNHCSVGSASSSLVAALLAVMSGVGEGALGRPEDFMAYCYQKAHYRLDDTQS